MGPGGLLNVGNTCYLNSAFQALRQTRPFQALFEKEETWQIRRHADRRGAALLDETAALVQAMKESEDKAKGPVNPIAFVREFMAVAADFSDEFVLGAQGDAAEALVILMDVLHTQIALPATMVIQGPTDYPEYAEYVQGLKSWAEYFRKEYSPLIANFYGQTRTRFTCKKCQHSQTRFEPWSMLKLEIPLASPPGDAPPTLDDCLAAFLSDELLDDYTCDGCGEKGSTWKDHTISNFPSYIMLSLKRFTNRGQKISGVIEYDPDMVDLSKWRAWPRDIPTRKARYRVVSTVEQVGTLRGGHYSARTRDPTGGPWREYDDASVTVASDGGRARRDTYVLVLEKI